MSATDGITAAPPAPASSTSCSRPRSIAPACSLVLLALAKDQLALAGTVVVALA